MLGPGSVKAADFGDAFAQLAKLTARIPPLWNSDLATVRMRRTRPTKHAHLCTRSPGACAEFAMHAPQNMLPSLGWQPN